VAFERTVPFIGSTNSISSIVKRYPGAGAKALGITDYGVEVGGSATLFTIAASGVPEAVAAHPPRKLVLFDGRIVARDGAVLPTPAPIA
jgi:hypothetical protein